MNEKFDKKSISEKSSFQLRWPEWVRLHDRTKKNSEKMRLPTERVYWLVSLYFQYDRN